jgi:hypothetical protein
MASVLRDDARMDRARRWPLGRRWAQVTKLTFIPLRRRVHLLAARTAENRARPLAIHVSRDLIHRLEQAHARGEASAAAASSWRHVARCARRCRR